MLLLDKPCMHTQTDTFLALQVESCSAMQTLSYGRHDKSEGPHFAPDANSVMIEACRQCQKHVQGSTDLQCCTPLLQLLQIRL